MTDLQIARAMFNTYDAAVRTELFRNGPKVIDANYGFRHGWIAVNGKGYNREMCFPGTRLPRFAGDQGVSD